MKENEGEKRKSHVTGMTAVLRIVVSGHRCRVHYHVSVPRSIVRHLFILQYLYVCVYALCVACAPACKS